jgi:putative transcriptional regulator
MKKSSKKFKNYTFLNILFFISSIFFIYALLLFNNVENIIRYLIISIVILLNILFINNYLFFNKNKNVIYINIKRSLMIIFSAIFIFVFIYANKTYKSINSFNKTSKYSYSLVALEEKSPSKETIAYVNESDETKKIAEEIKNLYQDNTLKEYKSYEELIKDLLTKKIKYAVLPVDFKNLLNNKNDYSKFKVLVTRSIVKKKTSTKGINKPFTMLLLGTDEDASSKGNSDVIMLVTVNPKTMNVTMLNIPRDTNFRLACTNDNERKINYASDDCIIKTLNQIFNVNIDYYVKVDFKLVVDLVDILGGIDMNVPHAICEQNSKRQWGKNVVLVEKGEQKLNGEQALALARHRKNNTPEHYKYCPKDKKYQEGLFNDFVRNEMQQEIIKAIITKAKTINSIDKFQTILSKLSSRVNTNMGSNTILSFYNFLINSNKNVHIDNMKLAGSDQYIKVSWYKTPIYFYVPNKESIAELRDYMAFNLSNNSKRKVDFSFDYDPDVNYTPKQIGAGPYLTNYKHNLLPDLTKLGQDEAEKYLKLHNIKYNIVYKTSNVGGKILSQSVEANTKLENVKSITLTISKKEEIKIENCETSVEEKCKIPDFTNKNINYIKKWESSYYTNLNISYYLNNVLVNSKNIDASKKIVNQSNKNILPKDLTVKELKLYFE